MDTEPPPVLGAHAPRLDGLRAVAVAAVAYSHWLPEWQGGLPFGAGVHLFFVLSGYLITGILLDLRSAGDRGAVVVRFYVRRALRLFPAFYLVLAVAALADVPLVRDTWPWHAGYLSNVFIASARAWQGHVSHFWSLAVEEQFYLVWPWLILWVPSTWLGPAIVAAVLVGPLARFVASGQGLTEPFWALVPGGSADSLALGAWLAWRLQSAATSGSAPPAMWRYAIVGGTTWVAMFVWERTAHDVPVALAIWRQVAQGLVFAWVVERAVSQRGHAWRVLAVPWVRYIGRISYGVYLVHAFAPILAHTGASALGFADTLPTGAGARAVLYAAVTVVTASVMWHLVEAPINARKTHVPYRR